jgi:hypothetical protein
VEPEHIGQQREVAGGVLLGAEVSREDASGGIIDGSDQRHCGTTVLEPGVQRGIDLEQQTEARCPFPQLAIPLAAAAAGARSAGSAQPAAEGRPRYAQSFPFGQQLAEVSVVTTGVQGVRSLVKHLLPNGVGKGNSRLSATVSVTECRSTVPPVGDQQPAHLPQ